MATHSASENSSRRPATTAKSHQDATNESSASAIVRQASIGERVLTVLVLLAIPAVTYGVVFGIQNPRHVSAERELSAALALAANEAQQGLVSTISVTRSLAVLLFANVNTLDDIPSHNFTDLEARQVSVADRQFEIFAREEMERFPSLVSIQTRPSNILTQIYPNGSAPYGLDLAQWQPAEVNATRNAGGAYISGPRQLAQGFPGFVTYWSIWLNTTVRNDPLPEYWGSAGVVIDLDRYHRLLRLNETGFQYRLFIENLRTVDQNVVLGDPAVIDMPRQQSLRRDFLGVSITLSMAPIGFEEVTAAEVAVGVIFAVVAALLFLIVLGMILRARWHEQRSRDTAAAPINGHVAIIFTDIAKSTQMWNNNAVAMRAALDIHHHAVRKVIARHGAYEVKTIGDSFMVACHSSDQALQVANGIHDTMMRQAWPREILQFPSASVIDGNAGEPLFCGLRLRIGIEVTTPFVVFDDVSKGYDYYGNGVNTAARINHACPAGTTLISRSIYESLSPDVRDDYLVGEVGHYELRGLKEPLHMYISVPKNLSARVADDDVVDQLQTFCSNVSPSFNEMAHSLGNAAALYMSPAETMGGNNNKKNDHSLVKIHDNDVIPSDDENQTGGTDAGLHSPQQGAQ